MAIEFGLARAVIRAIMPKVIDLGWSFNALQRYAQIGGYGYRREVMLGDWNDFLGLKVKADFFSSLPKDASPTREMMSETTERLSEKYKYEFGVNLYDPQTQTTLFDQNYSISQNKITSAQDAEDELVGKLETVSEPGLQVTAIRLVNVKR